MKKGEMRRDELLATAERLFYTKGYEKTSVQDILTEMNFSKGGFYHHFDSKLAVLEAICEMRARENCEQAKGIVSAQEGAIDKLNALFHDATFFGSGSSNFVALLIQVAYREDGALMREKMKACQLEYMQDVLEEILAEGVRTGVFFLTDIPMSAQMLLRLYMQFADDIAFLMARGESEEQMIEAMVAKLRVYRTAIERVLVAPFGSIVLFDAKELHLISQDIMKRRLRERADALLGS